ncbi:response regulator transcription factor [Flavobacterium sp.]|uniref:response regulator transcription factor n=1 Tax=Flavobacterium sp. TaxID=239 RepID=UPI00260244F0|nr:response regulator transcription factor [Flavobacterium sp.]
MNTTNVCIIDDHKIVRHGLIELLEKLGNIKVIHEFESGVDFLNALPLDKKADIYILDYSMPDLNGIEVLKRLEEKEEEYRVLLLTQHFDEHIINEAYNFGARGFLNKNCTAHDLKYAINNIVTIGYNNVSEILKRVRNYEETNSSRQKKTIELSAREHEFLTLVCDEKEFTYEQMAEKMGLSVKSLEGYRAAIFERYGIKSKVGLVLFSFKNKITEPFL